MGIALTLSLSSSLSVFLSVPLPLSLLQVYQACACMPKTGCFYPPTLITNVQSVSICVQEEVNSGII